MRSITPEYVESLRAYSRLLFDGGLGGKDVNRPERVAALIEIGRDLGIPATQALSWIAIINGKPSIYGDLGMAMIRNSGLLTEGYPKEGYAGDGDDYHAWFTVKRVGATEERTERFSIADAKRAKLWGKKGPWTEYPERQMMFRAKGFACRDEFQDVLCGLTFAEEARDFEDALRASASVQYEPPSVVAMGGAIVTPSSGQPGSAAPAPETFSLSDAADANDPMPGHPIRGRTQPPISDEQLERLGQLQELVFASKGLKDEAEQDAAWGEIIADYGVNSATKLTTDQAAELIETLGVAQDPFTHPPGNWKQHEQTQSQTPSSTPASTTKSTI